MHKSKRSDVLPDPQPAPGAPRRSKRGAFLQRLRKRRIMETLAAFIGGGWLSYEVVHWVFVEHYHFPEYLLDIAILAFFVALVCTVTWLWIRGGKRERAGVDQARRKEEPIAEKSIAVLYLENMSPDKESDYFCAGITEDIITDLSKIKELKVVSRADVLPFRNKEVNTRKVGEGLGVNFILEGSVRKAGNKIRITGQLIDVRTGFHVWAERFDRFMEDLFDLQNEVSRKIAEALRVSLSESEKESLTHKPTDDLRAYDLYLRGRELLYRRGKKNNELAIEMFENAVQIDPRFASAYAALAEADSYMYAWYDGDPIWLGKIIELNQKALSLEPGSAEALFGIGMVNFYQKRYGEAKRTMEKAIQLKPDYYDAYRWLGFIADIFGEYQEALGYYTACAKIKPYSEEPYIHFYQTYARMGNDAMAEQARSKLLELGERKLALNPGDAIALSRMAAAYAHRGDKEKAYSAMGKVLQVDPDDGLSQYNCACTYAVLGEREKALACLRKALEGGYKNIREWVKSDLDLASLHEDPDFKALLAEFG